MQADDLCLQPGQLAGTLFPPRFKCVSASVVSFCQNSAIFFKKNVFKNKSLPLSLAGFGTDVESFVLRTNYDEYAVMLQLSLEVESGNKSTNVVLYSERPTVPRFQGFRSSIFKWLNWAVFLQAGPWT